MKMPFGKFKNINIENIDANYLNWLLENSTNLDFYLKNYILKHLNNISIDINNKNEIRQIYISLCKKYHPDNGGSNEAMAAINDFYSILKSYK
jgi:hypothetical protein